VTKSPSKDHSFLFDSANAAIEVSHLNRLERGCYFDLIQAQQKFGAISLDQIKKILGKDFDACWPSLEIILSFEDEKYFINWLKENIEKRIKFSEIQKEKSIKYWESNNIPRESHGIPPGIPRDTTGISPGYPPGIPSYDVFNVLNNNIKSKRDCKGDKNPKPLWKESFAEYERLAGEAYDALLADSAWLEERKRYHPQLDLHLTLEKSFNDFWGQEAGWQHKKKQKTDEINWKRTFENALTLKANQVYEKR
jgi:hypothetical protein